MHHSLPGFVLLLIFYLASVQLNHQMEMDLRTKMNLMRTLMTKVKRRRKHLQQRSCGVFSSHDDLLHMIDNNAQLTVG